MLIEIFRDTVDGKNPYPNDFKEEDWEGTSSPGQLLFDFDVGKRQEGDIKDYSVTYQADGMFTRSDFVQGCKVVLSGMGGQNTHSDVFRR